MCWKPLSLPLSLSSSLSVSPSYKHTHTLKLQGKEAYLIAFRRFVAWPLTLAVISIWLQSLESSKSFCKMPTTLYQYFFGMAAVEHGKFHSSTRASPFTNNYRFCSRKGGSLLSIPANTVSKLQAHLPGWVLFFLFLSFFFNFLNCCFFLWMSFMLFLTLLKWQGTCVTARHPIRHFHCNTPSPTPF